jgi:hypothetical protein
LATRSTGIQPGGGKTFPSIIVIDNMEGDGYFTPREHPGTMALTTYMWMGSVEATKAYIDKLKAMYNSMPVKNIVISAEGTGQQGTSYYFEDTQSLGPNGEPLNAIARRDGVRAVNPNVPVTIVGHGEPFITTASDVSGFMTWGWNAGRGPWYSLDGKVTFTGNSGWYAIQTYESFNGWWNSWQGDFTDWFSANAFGGTNYSNTPAGSVNHVEEPTAGGVNGPSYFQCWEKRHLFIDCAWTSLNTGAMVPHGDPWITK